MMALIPTILFDTPRLPCASSSSPPSCVGANKILLPVKVSSLIFVLLLLLFWCGRDLFHTIFHRTTLQSAHASELDCSLDCRKLSYMKDDSDFSTRARGHVWAVAAWPDVISQYSENSWGAGMATWWSGSLTHVPSDLQVDCGRPEQLTFGMAHSHCKYITTRLLRNSLLFNLCLLGSFL